MGIVWHDYCYINRHKPIKPNTDMGLTLNELAKIELPNAINYVYVRILDRRCES